MGRGIVEWADHLLVNIVGQKEVQSWELSIILPQSMGAFKLITTTSLLNEIIANRNEITSKLMRWK